MPLCEVTLHLLGGLFLLALLAVQHEAYRARPVALAHGLRRAAVLALVLLVVQIALGGWVSTNYAVLACSGFPQCNGQWWPTMDIANGFTLLRERGQTGDGGYLTLQALVAIQMAHRLFAMVVACMLAWVALRLVRSGGAAASRFGWAIVVLLLLAQLGSGLSNVVLGWPLVAALAHSAGAAALVLMLTMLLARTAPRWQARPPRPSGTAVPA